MGFRPHFFTVFLRDFTKRIEFIENDRMKLSYARGKSLKKSVRDSLNFFLIFSRFF